MGNRNVRSKDRLYGVYFVVKSFFFSVHPHPDTLTTANAMQFWLLSGLGLALGLGVFVLASRSSSRRPQFQALGEMSPFKAMLLGLLVGGVIIVMAYRFSWLRFYQLDLEGDILHLRYFYPERTCTAERTEIEALETVRAPRGNRALIINLRDGSRHRSQDTPKAHFQEELERLEAS
jgi:hypothetical protein